MYIPLASYNSVNPDFVFNGELIHFPATYMGELVRYEVIDSLNLHIVANTSLDIGYNEASQILFAMLRHKPILMFEPPHFSKNIDLFAHELIDKRLSKIFILDAHILDQDDINSLLSNIADPINYVLTKHEKMLIRSRLKSNFRTLT